MRNGDEVMTRVYESTRAVKVCPELWFKTLKHLDTEAQNTFMWETSHFLLPFLSHRLQQIRSNQCGTGCADGFKASDNRTIATANIVKGTGSIKVIMMLKTPSNW